MSNRQFVACKFRPGDRRSYTYHWDGEPLTISGGAFNHRVRELEEGGYGK